MSPDTHGLLFLSAIMLMLVAIYAQNSEARVTFENGVKSEVYLARYYLRVNYQDPKYESNSGIHQSNYILYTT